MFMAKQFDENGVRIGDDGLPMTKARLRLHHLFNFCFIYMIVTVLVAIGFIAGAYFQGQELTDWELVAVGGNQFNGLPVATIMRVEALLLLFCAVICLFANMKGMARLYDNAPYRSIHRILMVMSTVSLIYFLCFTFVVSIPDPASLIMGITGLLGLRFLNDVEIERKLNEKKVRNKKGK
jgi:hypothetical protein